MTINLKKIIQLIVIVLGAFSLTAQPVTSRFQGGFDFTGTTISFKIKPDITGTATFSTIEFFVRVPDAAPVFSWGTINENVANFPGMGDFFINPTPPTLPGYRIYHFIYTAPAPITASSSYTIGSTYEVFSVSTSVDPGTLSMQMLHSPTDEDPFYLAITNGFGQDLRFPSENNFFFPATNIAGDPFLLNLSLATAPAFLKEFNVNKQGNNNALLDWTTSQEQNVSHFLLEKSVTGTNGWSKIAEVKAKGNSNTPTKYSYTDVKVYDGIQATKTIFFRIRSIDLDGQEKLFPVRSLRFSATGGKEISIYPNPVKDGFTISIPIVNPRNSMIRLNLVNHLGQQIHGREISAASATNYFYDIKTPGIINGEYMLQVIYDGELLDTKKIIVQR